MRLFGNAKHVIELGIKSGAFPAASVEVGHHNQILWSQQFGVLDTASNSVRTPNEAIFDLASLTKVIATTSVAMMAVDKDLLKLTDRVADWLPAWQASDRETVTIFDLLAHSSGLTPHLPFFRDCRGREEFEHAICTMPLEYQPRHISLYSDLGFILLGFILQDAFGQPLDIIFQSMVTQHGWGDLIFRPPTSWKSRTAPTETDAWRGRLLIGEVHDENAWALGEVAGHSGVFGSATAVGSFARTILSGFLGEPTLCRNDTFNEFITRTQIPNTSRALGWDMMRPTSSCGTLMSEQAIGHTGFTGTSLWLDPSCDAYVVFLTNRVNPTRKNQDILKIRPALHDAVMKTLA